MTNNEFKRLFEQSSFYQDSPEWRGIDKEEEYFYVPQESYLGETLICLSDTYENSAIDCLVIQELIRKYRDGEIK